MTASLALNPTPAEANDPITAAVAAWLQRVAKPDHRPLPAALT